MVGSSLHEIDAENPRGWLGFSGAPGQGAAPAAWLTACLLIRTIHFTPSQFS